MVFVQRLDRPSETLKTTQDAEEFASAIAESNLSGMDVNLRLACSYTPSPEIFAAAKDGLRRNIYALLNHHRISGLSINQRFDAVHAAVNNIGRSGDIAFRELRQQIEQRERKH